MDDLKLPEGMTLEYWLSVKNEMRFQKSISRVMSVSRDSYVVLWEGEEIYAEIPGNLRYAASSPLDLPVVGDWVESEQLNNNELAIILNVLPRHSLLKRKQAGNHVEFQPIAANVDCAFVIQGCDGNFNWRRMERYFSMIWEAGCQPAFILSKADLMEAAERKKIHDEFKKIYGNLPFFEISVRTKTRLNELEMFLQAGLTYCFLGSSGVGKTSLINYLLGEDKYRTREVREKDRRGRHATTVRQLLRLPSGVFVVDTPGMRELGNFAVEAGLSNTFAEIEEIAAQCRFSDCRHQQERGCAVLGAVWDGQISEERYRAYIKLQRENDYYEMSYFQKRKKEKGLAKMVRQIKRIKPKKR